LLNSLLGTLSSGVAASTSSYESIASVTAAGGETSLVLSSIPSTYVSLQMRYIGMDNSGGTSAGALKIRFNSDSGSNYSETILLGSGANAIAARGSNITAIVHNYTNTSIASAITNIMNYSNSNIYKSTLTRWNSTISADPYVAEYVGLWRNTTAITSLTVFVGSGNFVAGSIFTLYGIKAA
jgi:hypothetical protein